MASVGVHGSSAATSIADGSTDPSYVTLSFCCTNSFGHVGSSFFVTSFTAFHYFTDYLGSRAPLHAGVAVFFTYVAPYSFCTSDFGHVGSRAPLHAGVAVFIVYIAVPKRIG